MPLHYKPHALTIASAGLLVVAASTAACWAKDAASCQAVLQDMRQLASELRGFEGSTSFAQHGFSRGGPHYEWFDRAIALANRATIETFLGRVTSDQMVFPGEISFIGSEKWNCVKAPGNCNRRAIEDVERRLADMACDSP